ncbi:MAG: DDE-type integrase/transposase/recombinase [Sulfitobacter sp.]|nr:DDE-type integrase/transposase/recombinase [Sulfitobacter sp.]
MAVDETGNRDTENGESSIDDFEWGDGAGSLTAEPGSDASEDTEAQAILAELAEAVKTGEVSAAASAGTRGRRKGKRTVKPEQARRRQLTPTQRLLVLDVWLRSGLAAGDFAPLVGLSKHTLYVWKRDFKKYGPAALADKPRGGRGRKRKLSVAAERAILMLKDLNPDFGGLRISQELLRGQGLDASESQVQRVLREAGYETQEVQTVAHGQTQRRFERARPNQLWQTDIFQFVLKKQNRKVYLIGYMDDHSRYLVSFGLHTNCTSAIALEVLTTGIASFGPPEEVLTDNGPQYVSWRGRSRYSKELDKLGIKQVVARPKHPQTLGKIERFWQTLYRECVERAVFEDLEDARRRVGHFVDYYNYHRPHQGIEGLAPADRYFGVASEVKDMMAQRVADNALELARHGVPKRPFYLTGAVGGKSFSVHAAGERVVLSRAGGEPEEVELASPAPSEGDAALTEVVSASCSAVPEPLALTTPSDIFDQIVDDALASEPDRSPLDEALAEVKSTLERGPGDDGGVGEEVGDE